jgi:hypothetical protein
MSLNRRRPRAEQAQAEGVALACRVYPRSALQIELLPLPELT